jgi:2-oxoglutarate ferredoxin oxidoreductase subunit beta
VLALYFKLIEKRKMRHENITTVAGIGCSSRFRISCRPTARITSTVALPFASGVSLSRPDLHVFVVWRRRDAFPSAAII